MGLKFLFPRGKYYVDTLSLKGYYPTGANRDHLRGDLLRRGLYLQWFFHSLNARWFRPHGQ